MKNEISRTPTDENGVCIVQRTNGSSFETVREHRSSTGEITIADGVTQEIITITRTLGEKIQF